MTLLQDPQKITLLDQLIDGSMSWAEAEKESMELKSVETLKETFCKHAGCSMEEAEKYADVKHLRKFKVTKGKALPPDFKVMRTYLFDVETMHKLTLINRAF